MNLIIKYFVESIPDLSLLRIEGGLYFEGVCSLPVLARIQLIDHPKLQLPLWFVLPARSKLIMKQKEPCVISPSSLHFQAIDWHMLLNSGCGTMGS